MATEPDEVRTDVEEDEGGGPVKSFLEHLEDFRWVLIKSGVTVFVAMLLCLIAGDHVVASSQLYGRSLRLLAEHAAALGITSTVVDTCDLPATAAACTPNTRLVVVEEVKPRALPEPSG